MVWQGPSTESQFIPRGLVTALAALLFAAGAILLTGEMSLPSFAGSGTMLEPLLPLLVSGSGIYLLSWFNGRSMKKALFTVFIALILGIPLAFGVLAPVTEWALTLLLPSGNAPASPALAAAWFIILPVLVVELITGDVIPHRRWARLISAGVLSFVLVLFVEFIAADLGQGARLSWLRMLFCAPITWLIVVSLVSVPRVDA